MLLGFIFVMLISLASIQASVPVLETTVPESGISVPELKASITGLNESDPTLLGFVEGVIDIVMVSFILDDFVVASLLRKKH